jgi:hypothetical protein
VVVYDTINVDTTLIQIDSIAPNKNFSGILPCKDCDGINSLLTLHQDSSFQFAESKNGAANQDSLIERNGKYIIDTLYERNILTLKFKDGSFKFFQFYGDTAIQLLNSEKKKLETDQNTFLKKN